MSGEVLRECPFCGVELQKFHSSYEAVSGKTVEYDFWKHPFIDGKCIFHQCIDYNGDLVLSREHIPAWNRRSAHWTKFDAQDRATWPEELKTCMVWDGDDMFDAYLSNGSWWDHEGPIDGSVLRYFVVPEPMREED